MEAVIYQPHNKGFELSKISEPKLETPFDVMVEVSCVGLNPVDAKMPFWFDMVQPGTREMVGGLDVSGIIIAKGSQVSDWNLGDRVLYHGNMRRRQGGFAPKAIHDARTLTKHPTISSVEAAASPCAGWTAFRALHDKFHWCGQRSIVIYGASGGVGSYALQLSRHFQYETIIAICSEANFDYVRSLGATHYIDYRNPSILDEVMLITQKQGVDCALDCIGGIAQSLTSSMLSYDGQLVELVSTIDSSKHNKAFDRGLSLSQLSLGSGHVYGKKGQQSIVQAGIRMNALLENKEILTPDTRVISLSDVPEILEQMKQGHSRGKYVASFFA